MSKQHDPAKRAAVLMALAEKQPVTHISAALSVPIRTIYYWRDEARAAQAASGAPAGASEATSAASVASVASVTPARAARPRALPTSESERALRAELASANSKLSILRQALLIVAGG